VFDRQNKRIQNKAKKDLKKKKSKKSKRR
jgi:hypothetical protein